MVPFVGEIRMFGGNFAPQGWAFCDGASLPIAQWSVLYSLIGLTYGGDGLTTFDLPNLQGRFPIHQDPQHGFILGQLGGVEQVTLTLDQLTAHTHPMQADPIAGTETQPAGNVLAQAPIDIYVQGITPDQRMAVNMVGTVGDGQPHDNVQPFQCVNFIIALFGAYPSPT